MLLAFAIARQSAGWTARAMMASRGGQSHSAYLDDVGKRIQYFSSQRSGNSPTDVFWSASFGSFFPHLSADRSPAPNCKDRVYQCGSANGKERDLDMGTD